MKDKELQRVDQVPEGGMEIGGEIEIDLLELFYRLLENAKKIVAAAVAGMLIFAFYSFVLATPIYEATCRIYVTNASDSAINLSDLQIGSYLTSDYQEVFRTWEVHEAVIRNLGLDYTYEELEEMISVTNPSDTRILDVTISSDDPKEAAAMANEYAEVSRAYISRTMDTNEPTILSSALVPEKPVKPRKLFNTALGFVLGALVMIAVVTVQFLLDDKIKTSDDIRKYTDMAALSVVPSNDISAKPERGGSSGRKQRR